VSAARRAKPAPTGPGVASSRPRPSMHAALDAVRVRLEAAYAERLSGQHALTAEERTWLAIGHGHGVQDMLRVLEAAGLKGE
jgi:hypothetical protein